MNPTTFTRLERMALFVGLRKYIHNKSDLSIEQINELAVRKLGLITSDTSPYLSEDFDLRDTLETCKCRYVAVCDGESTEEKTKVYITNVPQEILQQLLTFSNLLIADGYERGELPDWNGLLEDHLTHVFYQVDLCEIFPDDNIPEHWLKAAFPNTISEIYVL